MADRPTNQSSIKPTDQSTDIENKGQIFVHTDIHIHILVYDMYILIFICISIVCISRIFEFSQITKIDFTKR